MRVRDTSIGANSVFRAELAYKNEELGVISNSNCMRPGISVKKTLHSVHSTDNCCVDFFVTVIDGLCGINRCHLAGRI